MCSFMHVFKNSFISQYFKCQSSRVHDCDVHDSVYFPQSIMHSSVSLCCLAAEGRGRYARCLALPRSSPPIVSSCSGLSVASVFELFVNPEPELRFRGNGKCASCHPAFSALDGLLLQTERKPIVIPLINWLSAAHQLTLCGIITFFQWEPELNGESSCLVTAL